MLKRLLTGFGIGLVIHGALRLLLSLTFMALMFYQLIPPQFILSPLVSNWGTVVVLAAATIPSGFFVGYYARNWGWPLSAILAPAWSVCAFPLSPFLQKLYLDTVGTGLDLGDYYIDWTLLSRQAVLGSALGLLSGVVGELVRLRLLRKEQQDERFVSTEASSTEAQNSYVRRTVRWYFPRSLWVLLRAPVLFVFGGLAVYILLSNAPLLLAGLLGGTLMPPESGEPVSLAPLATVIILQALFAMSPALILPWLWSSSVRLRDSSQLGLSISTILLWTVAFLVLSSLGLM
jgi:hypothetical protein